ncbi:MAG: hypothetical protein NTX50_02865 [Candidatus Sumerlaeota bacterium]|nr:hypothetical protein [Candidatus Sumerlaeota bacterium]
MTTPLAYLTTIPCIPFRIEKSGQIYFSYYTTGSAYILYCPGYDQRYDIDPIKDFTADTLPTSPSLVLKTYDPTNGLKSAGDIWRTNRGAPR